jgi:hypothetical protein
MIDLFVFLLKNKNKVVLARRVMESIDAAFLLYFGSVF